ncbi:hypothetical protein DRQ05_05230 [bacterium]|nr:MAG: hypothetical protein DRQ05_05230 [bacterium]
MSGEEKILCVDDEANILFAYRRQLRKQFKIDTALGGEEGLKAIEAHGPYAVVISDLKMPGMDGIRFLSTVRERSPDTVRVMVTGLADLEAVMSAINEGNIFRFLTKPVDTDVLIKAIDASIEQYRLITAERELLEKTLQGSVKVLTEVLSLVNPVAFSRTFRLKRYVHHICGKLNIQNEWQFDIAAMLSHIGCITLDNVVLEKVYAGQELTSEEAEAYSSHPDIGGKILENIPRLESVAAIIRNQFKPVSEIESSGDSDDIVLGSKMLRAAVEFDRLITRGESVRAAIAELKENPDQFAPEIVDAMSDIDIGPGEMTVKSVMVSELGRGMVLDEDVRSKEGILLVAKGQEVSISVLERLKRFSAKGEVEEPIRVLIPAVKDREEPVGVS